MNYKYENGNIPVHTLLAYRGVAPHLVNLGTGWILVVVFTPEPLFHPVSLE
jgi:hypothetical protein